MTAVVGESHHMEKMKKKEKGVVVQPFNTLGPLFLEMLVGELKLEIFCHLTSPVLENVSRYYGAFILEEEFPVIGH